LKTIEINTVQNVKIEYQLASVMERILATVLDSICIAILILIIRFVFSFFSDEVFLTNTLALIIMIVCISFYSLISEFLGKGQSLGKYFMGIKVIKTNGDDLEFFDFFNRWTLRLVDIWLSLGTLAVIFISSNKNGQRLGDSIAGTTVIKKKSAYGFKLKDILKLNEIQKSEYDFQFKNLDKLEEKDVLLIKNIIKRYKSYDNESHRTIVKDLLIKLREVLEIEQLPKTETEIVNFLNNLISEYIIYTR
jgi:uncharacterized RDD family membrane protein YckC